MLDIDYEFKLNGSGSRASLFRKRILARRLADLDVVFEVKQLATEFLSFEMIGLLAPVAHCFLGFKFHDGDALTIVGRKSLDGNETWHVYGEAVNSGRPFAILLLVFGPEA